MIDQLTRLIGGLVVLALFAMRWDVPRSIELFCLFVGRAFDSSIGGQCRPFSSICSFIRCFFGNGHYSANLVASALQDCLGHTRRLFDHPCEGISRSKFVLTATTVSDASTVIFPSYNLPYGHRRCSSKADDMATYRRLSRGDPDDEPRLWEA